MSRIEAVFLDIGGVFHLPLHNRIADALTTIGVTFDMDAIDRAHFAGVAAISSSEAMGKWREDEWRDPAALAYFGGYTRELSIVDGQREAAVDALVEVFRMPGLWTRIIPGSPEALRELARTGSKIGIVSNSDGTLEERLLAEELCHVGSGPGTEVAVICDSTACGVAKPDPKIFEIALDAVGVAPDAAIHVGDTVEADVEGAKAAGVRPLHLDPYGFCRDETHENVGSLTEVIELVKTSHA